MVRYKFYSPHYIRRVLSFELKFFDLRQGWMKESAVESLSKKTYMNSEDLIDHIRMWYVQ